MSPVTSQRVIAFIVPVCSILFPGHLAVRGYYSPQHGDQGGVEQVEGDHLSWWAGEAGLGSHLVSGTVLAGEEVEDSSHPPVLYL